MNEQRWTADGYARHGAFVPILGAEIVAWLGPRPGERIVDIGCGDGVLTRTLVDAGARVVGVDASPDLVAAARARGLDARIADAHELAFDREFDAAFSNAALHWMREPDRVIASVARALVPGGRFVGELGGDGNVRTVLSAVDAALRARGVDPSGRSPWYFPTADAYGARLRAGGFVVERAELVARPTRLPTGMRAWLETFAQPMFAGLDDETREAVAEDAIARMRDALCDRDGTWTADYVRLRFAARLPDASAFGDR